MPIKVICPSCGKNVQAPDSAAGKHGKCPGCGGVVKIPVPSEGGARSAPVVSRSTPPPPPPLRQESPARQFSTPTERQVAHPAADVQDARPDKALHAYDKELYPWETPPDVLDRAMQQIVEGMNPRYPIRGNQKLNTLEYMDLKSEGFKLDLHLLDDSIVLTEREPLTIPLWLYYLLQTILFIIKLPLYLASLGIALVFLGPLLLVAVFLLGIVYMALADAVGGGVAILVVFILLAATFVGIFLLFRNTQWVAKVIRKNPKSWLAILLLYFKTPFVPKVFRRGDVVQLICAHSKTGWFSSRSLLAFVQDRPVPRKRSLIDRITPGFIARRRIYYVWFDSGEQVAEEGAKGASAILGLEVTRAVIDKKKGMMIA